MTNATSALATSTATPDTRTPRETNYQRTDRRVLFLNFLAAASCVPVDLTIFERDFDGAEEWARVWAARGSRRVEVVAHAASGGLAAFEVVYVHLDHGRVFRIYRREL